MRSSSGSPEDRKARQGTAEQAAWIYRIVTDKTPEQCKLEFALWTAPLRREALQRKFGVRLSTAPVRRILRLSACTPPRPQRRAAQADQERVRDW